MGNKFILPVIRMFFRRLNLIKNEYGFTFADMLVGLTILSLTLMSIVPIFVLSAKVVASSEAELSAVNLANKELEKARSLGYDDVGTTAGNPAGVLNPDFDQGFNGKTFHIKTRVNWQDGEYDGVYPNDFDPRDYKKVVITVSWTGGLPANQEVKVSTLISRESKEQVAVGGNIETIAKDVEGNLLEDVHIQITTGPSSPINDWTNSEGKAMFYLLDPSEEEGDYTVSASKDGWLVRPDDQNQTCTVILNQTRTIEFMMARPGNLEVNLRDPGGNLIEKNSRITLLSTELGRQEFTSKNGHFEISDLFPISYDITAWAASYQESTPISIKITTGETTQIDITLTPKPTGGIHLTVYDESTGNPVSNADVVFVNNETGDRTTGKTNNNGIYEDHFEAGDYEVEVSKNGYQTVTQTISIVASENKNLDVYLSGAPTYGSILVRAEHENGAPRNYVQVRVNGSGYNQVLETGSYADGEALFDNLRPGTYQVYRFDKGWKEQTTVTVTAGNRNRVLYRWDSRLGEILVRAEYTNGSPRNNVQVRVNGSGYNKVLETGSYADGEALFEDLNPGTYTVYRWSWGWRNQYRVTVSAGQRNTVVYSW